MHEANEVNDGLWMIRQETATKWIFLSYCGKIVAQTQRDELLQFDELRSLLTQMRNEVRSEEE